jgi:hypothetical protein
MNSRIAIKNLVVAFTLGLAGIATWAVTQSEAPAIDVAAAVSRGA